MKTMRLAVLAAALCIGATTVARAQDTQSPPQRPRGMMNMTALFQGITLTHEQQEKVDKLAKKHEEDAQKMREEMQAGGDREAMMTKMREMRTKHMDEIKEVLTPEQRAIFEKNVEEMRANRGQRPPGAL